MLKLKTLFKGVLEVEIKGTKEIEITGISDDSRTVVPGNLFIARQGTSFNGIDFISQAIAFGAHAILTDFYDPFLKITQIITKNPSDFSALLASRLYENPSHELFVVGVTGTKGKTTTTYMIHHLMTGLKLYSGLAGTVEMILGDERRSSTLTTQGCIQNQKLLKEMVTKGCEAVVLEISSHGLDQGRTEKIQYDVVIFTNLYPDHLDYHATLEEYALAKKKLFLDIENSQKKIKRILLNIDNPWSSFMQKGILTPHWTFGIDAPADIRAQEILVDEKGTHFWVEFQGQRERFFIPFMGRFNVYNALGTIGVGLHRGSSLLEIKAIMQTFHTVPGRLEQVINGRGIHVFVDYAHTGEALENVLLTLREIAKKRIICVFGCGGNRDAQRRKNMANAAEKHADISVITSDNPRKEDPMSICEEIRHSFQNSSLPLIILDRKAAIHHAIEIARSQDIVLIAGKGHEKVQIFANQTISFDDVAVAKEALQN